MSDHEQTAEVPKAENEEVEKTDEAAPQTEVPVEELQQVEPEKKDEEVPPEHETGVEFKVPIDAESHMKKDGIDESHGTDLIEPDKKEEDDLPFTSVSFADVMIKDSVDDKAKSIASVMSYDSLASVDGEVKARAALGSIISIRRGSAAGGEYYDRHKAPKYMNSYKLEPDKSFHVEKVENFMREILTEALKNSVYDADKTPKQAKWASSAMRAKLKEQEYDRCKFICIVTMGEKQSQDVHSIFRFLWDPDRDKFAQVVHENMTVFAVAVCFGIYYE